MSDSLPPAVSDAIEAEAEVEATYARARVRAQRRVDFMLAIYGAQRGETPTGQPSRPAFLTRKGLAKALGCSVATVDREVRSGMPFELVGSSKRFDLEAVRAWMASRSDKPAPACDPDVSRIAMAAGLRVVAGR